MIINVWLTYYYFAGMHVAMEGQVPVFKGGGQGFEQLHIFRSGGILLHNACPGYVKWYGICRRLVELT